MKILKVFGIIFFIVAIVLIPISLFDVSGKTIIGIVGYVSLIIGAIFSLIITILRSKNKK